MCESSRFYIWIPTAGMATRQPSRLFFKSSSLYWKVPKVCVCDCLITFATFSESNIKGLTKKKKTEQEDQFHRVRE